MAPALAPAYLTAGLFAFLASMDNYPVSIFLTDARTKTLPIKMLQYIEECPDPSIAALSTLILIATLALLLIADRAVGLHRLAGLAEQRHDDRARAVSGRDFLGYGRVKPAPRWPGDARVAVSFVVNFEEGAEFSISDGDDRNEAIYEVEHRLEGMPDPCLDSHFEYGARAGWWRVMDVLDAHGVKATVSACGRAVERLPVSRATPSRAGMRSPRTAGAGRVTPA